MKLLFPLLFSITLFFSEEIFSKTHHNNYLHETKARISDGNIAPKSEYPFVVSLQILDGLIWKHYCGGSIMSSQKVLTAASCFTDLDNGKLHRIVAGSSNLKHMEMWTRQIRFFRISSVTTHPMFDRKSKSYNIAIVRIKSPWRFTSFVKSVELDQMPSVPGNDCFTAGWGQPTYRNPSALLRSVAISPTDLSSCLAQYNTRAGLSIDGPVICAGGATLTATPMPTKNGLCFGDIGGPLICGKKLLGIASFFYGPCDSKFFPDIFGDVTDKKIQQWIMSS